MPNIDSDPGFITLCPEDALAHRFPRTFSTLWTLWIGLSPLTFDSKGRLVYNHSWS